MFKFRVVESPQKNSTNKYIKLMIEKMKFFPGTHLPIKNHINPTFILAEDINKDFLGGACLLKKRINDIQEDLGDLITTLTIHEGFVWECSNIYLDFAKNPSCPTYGIDLFSQNFYQGLYEQFVEFGLKNKMNFIIIKLIKEAYLSTKEFGLWPYVVEFKPENSSDGFFHGILPLTGSQYRIYQKTLKKCS